MAHSFTVNFKGDLSSLLENVKQKIAKEGGNFNGDASSGSLSGNTALGTVFLDYQVQNGNAIQFTVTKKPMLAPNSSIESTVRGYLS